MPTDIYIKNADVIPVVPRGKMMKDTGILIENGEIIRVDDSVRVAKDVAGHEVIDAKGHVVLPGLVNAHTHLPEALLRGICDDRPLEQWLWDHVWVMEARMTKKEAAAGARLGCLELIKNGVTGFIDQFYYANELAEAVRDSGIRALLCPSIFNDNAESGSIENCLKRACTVANEWQDKHPRIRMGLGPHAPYTVDKDILLRVKAFADKLSVPIHIHISETRWELEQARANFGMSPVQYLESIGLLEARVLAAHCVHVDDKDIALMKTRNVHVLHNPTSNLKLSSGIAPVTKFLERGMNVAIGTDGNASNNNLDVIEEVRLAALLQKNLTDTPTVMPIEQAIELATLNGAKAMGMEHVSGTIENGKAADLIIVNRTGVHMVPQHNILSNLIYSSNPADIRTLIVDGELVMEERKVLTLDEEKVIEDAERAAAVLKG